MKADYYVMSASGQDIVCQSFFSGKVVHSMLSCRHTKHIILYRSAKQCDWRMVHTLSQSTGWLVGWREFTGTSNTINWPTLMTDHMYTDIISGKIKFVSCNNWVCKHHAILNWTTNVKRL